MSFEGNLDGSSVRMSSNRSELAEDIKFESMIFSSADFCRFSKLSTETERVLRSELGSALRDMGSFLSTDDS